MLNQSTNQPLYIEICLIIGNVFYVTKYELIHQLNTNCNKLYVFLGNQEESIYVRSFYSYELNILF